MSVWGYMRVSADSQSTENQKLVISEYANKKGLTIDNFIEVKMSLTRSTKERKIDELLDQIQEGDFLIVAELSRLGGSVGQIAILIDQLIKRKVRVVCLKESINLNGKKNIQNEVISMFRPQHLLMDVQS
ncbi:MAG: recombinase family protein [Deltaproteobacteria bacterium]|nr:recombinase family protein [Deltaproteobacteria bacterium]